MRSQRMSAYIPLLSLVVSVIAIVEASFGLYWNNLRNADYKSGGLRGVTLFQQALQGGNAFIGIPIVVSNTGAKPGIVCGLSVSLEDKLKGNTMKFWDFVEGDEPPVFGCDYCGDFRKRCSLSFTVPPGTSVRKYLWFICEDRNLRFEPGDYKLSVFTRAAASNKEVLLVSQTLRIKNAIHNGTYISCYVRAGEDVLEVSDASSFYPIKNEEKKEESAKETTGKSM